MNFKHQRSSDQPMDGSIHPTVKDGFKEGPFYDRNRPSYTEEQANAVIDSLCTTPSERVEYNIVELGSGTGKFTVNILGKLKKGYTYLATDPLESFLSVLEKNVPGVETAICPASKIPLPVSSVQNIICADSFHWFSTVESMTEMTRVLVPNGRIIMLWNTRDVSVDWVSEIEAILTEFYAGTPRPRDWQWKKDIEGFAGLETLADRTFPGTPDKKGDIKSMVEYFLSISVIDKLGTNEKAAVCTSFHAVFEKYFTKEQEINVPYITDFYCAAKI